MILFLILGETEPSLIGTFLIRGERPFIIIGEAILRVGEEPPRGLPAFCFTSNAFLYLNMADEQGSLSCMREMTE